MDRLLKEALLARKNAYAPYSNFLVGAAAETECGHIYRGCNIENASFGATVCAERTAIFQAVANGARKIRRIAVAAEGDLTPPCGICLQVMREFGVKTIVLINLKEQWQSYTLEELLPVSFGSDNLG